MGVSTRTDNIFIIMSTKNPHYPHYPQFYSGKIPPIFFLVHMWYDWKREERQGEVWI